MITGRDILYISSIEWDFLWQAHQEIARRLAAAGNRVLYIENTGVRSPGLRDTKRVAARLGRWTRSLKSGGAREVAPNIFVYSPLVLPPFGSTLRRLLNRHVFLRQLRGITRAMRMKDVLLWTYLPTDTAVDIIRAHRTKRSKVVYYNAADFSYLTPNSQQLQQSERELVRMSDLVFATCSEQAKKFRSDNPNVHTFPPGVDMSAFPDDSAATDNLPDRLGLSSLPRPIIGYVGGLHRFVDYDLVAAMARARPSWSWVFLGAHQVSLEKVQDLPNVRLLGQQPHAELARHLRFFDVCIVPYLKTRETSTVVPTKINEYLAAGKATVSSDLPTVCEFNEQHHVLSTTTVSAEEFLRAIETELPTANDAERRKQRRKVAALADWHNRLEEMSGFLERGEGSQRSKVQSPKSAQAN
jgi:glycosyltransferase involved in cell wall biosynthesis